MVVYNIKYHFQSRVVNCADHVLELVQWIIATVARHRSEEIDRVVAPEISQVLTCEVVLVYERVNRHQFDGSDAQGLEIAQYFGIPHAREFSTLGFCDGRVLHGVTAHVTFVENGFLPRNSWPVMLRRIKCRRHYGQWDIWSAVLQIDGPLSPLARLRVEHSVVPDKAAIDLSGVRVNEQLGRVASQSAIERPRPVHAIAVALFRITVCYEIVPNTIVTIRKKLRMCLLAGSVEKTQFDVFGYTGIEREVCAVSLRC